MNKANLACLLFTSLALAACSPRETPAAPEPAPAPAPPTASVSSSCPNLTLTATPATAPSRDVAFTASVEDPPASVTYYWNVTAGAITAGQGTPTITVAAPVGEPVTTTVEVAGISSGLCYGSATIDIP